MGQSAETRLDAERLGNCLQTERRLGEMRGQSGQRACLTMMKMCDKQPSIHSVYVSCPTDRSLKFGLSHARGYLPSRRRVPKACAWVGVKLAAASQRLTWTLCEVVEAAVLGGDAAHVAVARPVHAVHPPVGGGAAQLSASAALSRAAPRHRPDAAQRQQQQEAGGLGRGSHRRGVRPSETPSRRRWRRKRRRWSSLGFAFRCFLIIPLAPPRFYSTSVISVTMGEFGISKAEAKTSDLQPGIPAPVFPALSYPQAGFRMQSPPFRLGSHSHCVLGLEWHSVAQRWSLRPSPRSTERAHREEETLGVVE